MVFELMPAGAVDSKIIGIWSGSAMKAVRVGVVSI
jgi:hypothetical protein